ncbi:retropepsin-like aspartic protease family protein [Thiorhodococcus minor]|uniref:Clan AA aspartic protease n=1 Tax=Thiorhodococcus minor TaxID=57489 RepID=A0A6M0JV31_9GAMM|nr:retropepsin-like aspartic protease [Thiorhodococcus minor]NEV61029.1 clan AA aspartic protease [Thiorhodococcus minor]
MIRPATRFSVALMLLIGALLASADPTRPLPRVEVSGELARLMQELDFEVKGIEQTQDAIGHAGGEDPVERLHLLLEDFDHIILQGSPGEIERVIILGEKSDYVPPPLVVEGGADDAEAGAGEDEGGDAIILTTRRQGASHVVTLGLEGPSKQRVEEAMLIDTGADRVVLPMSLVSALGLGSDALKPQQVQTANGTVDARIGRLSAVWLGETRVEDVEVAFIDDQKLGGTSLLGMSLLGRFRMTIDDDKNQLTLATK